MSDGLPADRELLALLQRDLIGLRKDIAGMTAAVGRALGRLAAHLVACTSWEQARQARMDAGSDYAGAYRKLAAAGRGLVALLVCSDRTCS